MAFHAMTPYQSQLMLQCLPCHSGSQTATPASGPQAGLALRAQSSPSLLFSPHGRALTRAHPHPAQRFRAAARRLAIPPPLWERRAA